MNKKIIGVLGLVIIIIFIGLFLKNGDRLDQKDTIKIGVAVPMTGTNGFVGEAIRDALLLAQKKSSNTKYKYEIVFEDVQVDPKMAASAAQKLINIDRVDAIIDAYAPVGNTIAPIAEKAKVVHIAIAFDPRAAEGEYNFINFTTPDTSVRAFLSELKKRNITTLGIFRLNNPGIIAVYDSIKALAPDYGVTIKFDEQFQPGERDFRGIIVKALKSKADIFTLLSIPPEIDILAKQMFDLNIHNITTVIYFELSPNKSIYEGLWSIGFGEVNKDFIREFKDTYNKEIAFGTPNAYDAFNIILNVAESYNGAGKPTTKYLADQITKLKGYVGVLGELKVNPEGIIDSAVRVKTVKDGVLVPVI